MSLSLVATPIGNLGDLSPRAAEILGAADYWIVEDTRVSVKLQRHLGLKKAMRVLNDHSTDSQIEKYVEELRAGGSGALVTDGGSPVISDPGALLIDRCLDADLEVAVRARAKLRHHGADAIRLFRAALLLPRVFAKEGWGDSIRVTTL